MLSRILIPTSISLMYVINRFILNHIGNQGKVGFGVGVYGTTIITES